MVAGELSSISCGEDLVYHRVIVRLVLSPMSRRFRGGV